MIKWIQRWLGITSHADKEQFILKLLGPEPVIAAMSYPPTPPSVYLTGLDIICAPQSPLSRGTVYVTLSRMVDDGLIESRHKPITTDLARREYGITAKGRRYLYINCN